MLREDGDPDAHADGDRLLVDGERLVDGLQDLFRDQHRPRNIGRAPGHNRKLVATVTGNGVGFTQNAPHALADLLQKPVTRFVAETVVDALEPIEVHEQHRTRFHLSLAGADRLFQPLAEKGAVGKPGQRIV